MKQILSTLFIALVVLPMNAQTTNEGKPLSWKILKEKSIKKIELPQVDVTALKAEDAINDQQKTGPWRFGYDHAVNVNLDNSGAWEMLKNGDKIWRARFESQGAIAMRLIFSHFDVPQGAKLYLYSSDMSDLLGAYTNINNSDHHQLGTDLVKGDDLVVEYFEPANVKGQGKLEISYVTHAYRGFDELIERKGLNNSGDCNIDVDCPLGNNWEDQKRAVAMIVTGGSGGSGGSGTCTGALVNNTANDGTPYFLTANHCLGNPNNWAFRFNWKSPNPSCATTTNSTDGSYNQTMNGSTLKASNGGSDVALVEINNTIPASWNVFYAGWDNSDADPTQETGIHHPNGDIMKICQDTDGAYKSTSSGAKVWWIDQWEQGVTEPGSSGSPLFDQNGRVIGQLFGGSAACSGTVDNGGYDFYGRFGVSWDGSNSSSRLKDWLDPNNSGAIVLDGYPLAAQFALDGQVLSIGGIDDIICGVNTITPKISIRNAGTSVLTSLTLSYQMNGGSSSTFNWSGSLASGVVDIITLPAININSGNNTLSVTASSPNGSADQNNANNVASKSFTTASNHSKTLSLELLTDNYGNETSWKLINSAGTVVFSGSGYDDNTTYVESMSIIADDCYTFTIYDSYGDGICCGLGSGHYTLTDITKNQTIVTGGEFNSDESTLFFSDPTISLEKNVLSNVVIYPNPSNGLINVNFSESGLSNVNVQVIDAIGRLILSSQLSNTLSTIDLNGLKNGIYIVKITNGKNNLFKKITLAK